LAQVSSNSFFPTYPGIDSVLGWSKKRVGQVGSECAVYNDERPTDADAILPAVGANAAGGKLKLKSEALSMLLGGIDLKDGMSKAWYER